MRIHRIQTENVKCNGIRRYRIERENLKHRQGMRTYKRIVRYGIQAVNEFL
jgi:hypothetical protein